MAYAKNGRVLLAAVVVTVLLLGAGVAYANGGDSSGKAAGAGLDKAKSIALDHVNGRVTGTEVGDEEGYYEVEVTRDDGSQVDVHLDRDFNVLGAPADDEGDDGEDGKDGPEDGGD